jgi:hypothetical protein
MNPSLPTPVRRATRLLATLRLGLASPEHAKFAAKLTAKLAKKAK